MTDLLTIKQAMHTSWSTAQHHTARAALWSAHHPFVSVGLLYGMLTYLGFAVLIGVPGRAIIALMIVGPAAWWCFGRYGAWVEPRAAKLNFFTWDNGPLRLSEDICSSKVVYCVGVRNEGTKTAGSVRVNIDSVEGYAPPTSEASLPIFRSPDNSVSLQPGESEYFCVMRKMDGAGADDGSVAICCHDNPTKSSFSIQELADGRTITLSAHSEGARRATRQIQISSKREADATSSLDMRLLPAADEALVRAPEQRPVAAGPPQVRAAWNRVRAKLSQLGELSFAQRGKNGFARETSARTDLPHGPVEHAATQGERLAPEVEAVVVTSPDKGTKFDAVAEESPAQSERIRRLLARQARA
jgi:hypothetical protein